MAIAFISTNAYQLGRVQTFLDPFRDPLGAGYNTLQGSWRSPSAASPASAWARAEQKYLYLPAPSTDFIFAIIGEEWGLIGTITVVALFASSPTRATGSRSRRPIRSAACWPPASRPGSSSRPAST